MDAWSSQLDSVDLDDLLSAAEFVSRKLDAPHGVLFSRWLDNAFGSVKPVKNAMHQAVSAAASAGVPFCTLNYDDLLESVTDRPSIHLGETRKVLAWMQRNSEAVLHLHGLWSAPETCLLGIRSYDSALNDEMRSLVQRGLASFNRLLFVGCGDTFSDPNFNALTGWLRTNLKGAGVEHYALVSSSELKRRNEDPSWHGFVEPICYGDKHSDLPDWLASCFSGIQKIDEVQVKSSAEEHQALQDYRDFLVRDCGQMTIEGVRADIDTAQRRFDLERLFVPLQVDPVMPEFPEADPKREEKIKEWVKQNPPGQEFGTAFAAHKRIALLALPGGGKTLLLKRLAVAYSDGDRRSNSQDYLPDLLITPILIRCREWRGQIHLPIVTIINNLSVITGIQSLEGLDVALHPRLESGEVLLLVDGLDEIHNDLDRATFVENLEKFLRQYPKIRLVVTSREAGFDLVAPVISQFCTRWRVAPLEEPSIRLLCDFWHLLMAGDTPEARAEAVEVADRLVTTESLRRLAENPLLLTMLLVVKHGAGRLPPDRVSLYDRAVEVLLDTWNIKGHEALNLKEAVPQLACVAFELMRQGKQTATEEELLQILEEARDKVPQIRRYAKGTPYEFLKRVELRSSLVVEAGHLLERGSPVPFYQFRHLTFQEYLSAVAVVGGHYLEYHPDANVLTPLLEVLTADEWKEVIPMAAVLARKQAEPLVATLVAQGNALLDELRRGDLYRDRGDSHKPPPPVSRLIQCLAEEAEASPDTLSGALRLVVLFGRGCQSADNWSALAKGPYAEELIARGLEIYSTRDWKDETWVRNTVAVLCGLRFTDAFWQSDEGFAYIRDLIESDAILDNMRGLLTMSGLMWGRGGRTTSVAVRFRDMVPGIERYLSSSSLPIAHAAAWVWGLLHRREFVRPKSGGARRFTCPVVFEQRR